jgi:hypothetical protein
VGGCSAAVTDNSAALIGISEVMIECSGILYGNLCRFSREKCDLHHFPVDKTSFLYYTANRFVGNKIVGNNFVAGGKQ